MKTTAELSLGLCCQTSALYPNPHSWVVIVIFGRGGTVPQLYRVWWKSEMALEKCIVGRVNWPTQVAWVLDAVAFRVLVWITNPEKQAVV